MFLAHEILSLREEALFQQKKIQGNLIFGFFEFDINFNFSWTSDYSKWQVFIISDKSRKVSSIWNHGAAKAYEKLYIFGISENLDCEIWSKIESLVKNWKFGQKLKVWSKIENLVENWKFGQKLKMWSKIENLVKTWKFGQKFLIKSSNNLIFLNIRGKHFMGFKMI